MVAAATTTAPAKPRAVKTPEKFPEKKPALVGVTPKMGMIVRDRVTGFTGVFNAICEMMTGNVQYGIQPPCEPGSNAIPEDKFIDSHFIEAVDLAHSADMPAHGLTDIVLGDRVREMTTGITGICTEKMTFQNGCVYFHVQPKVKRFAATQDTPGGRLFPHQRLTKLGGGVVKQLLEATQRANAKAALSRVNAVSKEVPKPPLPVTAKPPGGPMRSGASMRQR